MGRPTIGALGHLRMMAAVQPFLSGGISKTVNLKEETTVGELEALLIESWKLGIKAVAVYRDNCKVGQPLSAGKDPTPAVGDATAPVAPDTAVIRGAKDRLPRSRRSRTFEFRVADCKGYATVGEYDDGRPGELFVRVSKQGSTLAGIMDAFAISVSHGLQYGVPLASYVRGLTGMRFEPAGMTDDPDIRIANSLMDYLFRRLALDYLSETDRAELGIFSVSERLQPTLPGVEEGAVETVTGQDLAPIDVGASTSGGPPRGASQDSHAPLCMQCGVQMVRSGSCHACPECGSTSGCS
jgi:ribonucleoside-diphosphate reductase alpha chain